MYVRVRHIHIVRWKAQSFVYTATKSDFSINKMFKYFFTCFLLVFDPFCNLYFATLEGGVFHYFSAEGPSKALENAFMPYSFSSSSLGTCNYYCDDHTCQKYYIYAFFPPKPKPRPTPYTRAVPDSPYPPQPNHKIINHYKNSWEYMFWRIFSLHTLFLVLIR